MKGLAALAVVLSLFSGDAAAQSAPCVNDTDAMIAAKAKVLAALKEFRVKQCGPTSDGAWAILCIASIDKDIDNSNTAKELDGFITDKGNRCLEKSKQQAAELVKSLPNCRLAPDSPTTIQCKTLASFDLCKKANPWSPGNCHIWGGQPMAPCCKSFAYD